MRYARLSALERVEISLCLGQFMSLREIAKRLNRNPSTVSREVRKLRYKHQEYRPALNHALAIKQASNRRKGKRKLIQNAKLREVVLEKLRLYWSPHQIENFLKVHYEEASMQISKESIYTYLYVFLRRHMREEFLRYMRQGRRRRRKNGEASKPHPNRVLGDFELIDERPAEVNDRLVPGHWEGDLMIGGAKEQSALGTLVERTTRFAILVPLKNKTAQEVRTQFAKAMNKLPQHLKRTLTYDQGSEMAQHRLFTKETDIKVFFAHPRSPWERGTNENTNGLIRQFFPKGTNFNDVTPSEIQRAQDLLNGRPRKTLNWKTPAEKVEELLR